MPATATIENCCPIGLFSPHGAVSPSPGLSKSRYVTLEMTRSPSPEKKNWWKMSKLTELLYNRKIKEINNIL